MGFFDDLFNEDIMWVVLLLLLVFILPRKCSEPIVKSKGSEEEGIQCGKEEGTKCGKEEDIKCGKEEDIKCGKDIIYRSTRSQRERRRLVF